MGIFRSHQRIRMEPGDTFGGTVPLILLHQVSREPQGGRLWPWVLGVAALAAVGLWAGMSVGIGDMLADVRGTLEALG